MLRRTPLPMLHLIGSADKLAQIATNGSRMAADPMDLCAGLMEHYFPGEGEVSQRRDLLARWTFKLRCAE